MTFHRPFLPWIPVVWYPLPFHTDTFDDKGTYFAVKASYSTQPTYSRPDQDGNQLMFVARVLTGQYTQGKANMIIPPPRSPQLPNDRYDSLVDDIQNPTMFIVFHDDQAYPEYLITFKQGCSL